MKTKIKVEKEIEIASVRIRVPVSYDEEDIPNDFPLRKGDVWCAEININTGQIRGWPRGRSGELSMKVCDEGTYSLLDKCGGEIAKIVDDYVPHGVVPGQYGDYIILNIDTEGVVTNWPKRPDVSKFFGENHID